MLIYRQRITSLLHLQPIQLSTNLRSRLGRRIVLLTKTCFELRWRAKNSNKSERFCAVLSTINQVINQGKGTFDLVNQSRLDVGQSIKANLLKALTSLDLGHVTANLA